MTIKGYDVSSYQSSTFSLSGISFVIVKATEGTNYVNPKQAAQAAHARKAGLHVGFYHFVRKGDMKAQAAYFAAKCLSIEGDSLWLDWEDASVSGSQKDVFLKELKRIRPTHRVGLYCNQNFWLTRDKTSYAADGLWIANYTGTPGKTGIQAAWVIHQYNNHDTIDKTRVDIDVNVAKFSTKADMIAWAKKSAPAPKPTPKPTPPAPRVPEYLEVSGYLPELKYGDEGWYVGWMQRNLNRFNAKNVKQTNKYDAATAKAVDTFYLEQLDYKTTTAGHVFGADGWRRVLSITDKPGA